MTQRYAVVATQYGLPTDLRDASPTEVAEVLEGARHLSPSCRAALAWLVCVGQYATEDQQEALAIALDAGDLRRATMLLRRGISGTSPRLRARHLKHTHQPLVDITRVSLETGTTGIPRIVRLLAGHVQAHPSAQLVVWVGGAPARVSLDADGRVVYPVEVWGHTRRWFSVSRGLRRMYWRVMSGLARLPGGYAMRSAFRVLLAPFKLLDLGVAVPREMLLISDAGVFEPEVTSHDAALRLLAWLDANQRIPLTLAVYDLLPISCPQFFARDERLEFLDYARLIRRSSHVVVASGQLRDAVLGMAALQNRETPPSVAVLPFPSYSGKWQPDTSVEVNRPAFYMVGGLEGRKNSLVAITAMQVLAESRIRAELHLIGARRGVSPQIRYAIRQARRAGADILVHGAKSDEFVAGIARKSLALLYLSKAEGYGLPVREAQFLGRPVIASEIPSNVELARDLGVRLVNHRSPRDVAEAMRDLVEGNAIDGVRPRDDSMASVAAYCEQVYEVVKNATSDALRSMDGPAPWHGSQFVGAK